MWSRECRAKPSPGRSDQNKPLAVALAAARCPGKPEQPLPAPGNPSPSPRRCPGRPRSKVSGRGISLSSAEGCRWVLFGGFWETESSTPPAPVGVAREASTAGWPPAGCGAPGPEGSGALPPGAPGCPGRAALPGGGPGAGSAPRARTPRSAGPDGRGVFSPAAWIGWRENKAALTLERFGSRGLCFCSLGAAKGGGTTTTTTTFRSILPPAVGEL